MVEAHVFGAVHFALFDSVNDGDHIWREFKAVENLFGENAIIIVDDVLWGDKGRLLKPYSGGFTGVANEGIQCRIRHTRRQKNC